MRPVSYSWKECGATRYGFLAQQVLEAAKAAGEAGGATGSHAPGTGAAVPGVVYDANSDRYGLNYAEFIAPTVKAVQEIDKGQQDINVQAQGNNAAIGQLKAENELLKSELCRKDKSYSFCG